MNPDNTKFRIRKIPRFDRNNPIISWGPKNLFKKMIFEYYILSRCGRCKSWAGGDYTDREVLWRLQGQGGVMEITGTGRCGGDYGDREVGWRLRGQVGVVEITGTGRCCGDYGDR